MQTKPFHVCQKSEDFRTSCGSFFGAFWRSIFRESYYIFVHNDIIYKILSHMCRWAGHVARMVNRIGVFRVLVGKLQGKRPLRRRRRRWEDNIEMDLQGVGCGGGYGLDRAGSG